MIGAVLSSVLALTALVGRAAAAQCGTAKKNLGCLAQAQDFKTPMNTPCALPQCDGGKLPWNIFYQVCGPLQTETSGECNGAAVCQSWPPSSTASLGEASTLAYFDGTDFDGVEVRADKGTVAAGVARSFVMKIICAANSDPYPTFTEEVDKTLEYHFEWKRTEACGSGCEGGGTPAPPGAPTPPPGPGQQGHEGIGTGSWILIIMLIVVVVYLVGGMLFMAFVKGARGVEVVPNLTFWQEFPSLVKDGVSYSIAKVTKRDGYTPVV